MSGKESDSAAPAKEGTTPDGSYSKAIRKGDYKVEPKLGSNNYLTWADDMQLLLKSKRMWRIVNGAISSPDPVTHPKDYEE